MKIIGRTHSTWDRYLARRIIPRPKYACIGNLPTQGVRAWYSEDDLYDIRDAIAEIPAGGSQKAGAPLRRTKVLTKQELRAKLGDGRMLYVQNENDEFVPIWSDNI